MNDDALIALANTAGLAPEWTDAFGVTQNVPRETLVAVLGALGYPAGNARDIGESRRRIAAHRMLPAMLVVRAGETFSAAGSRAVVHFADGREGALTCENGLAVAPRDIGYHRIELDGEIRDLAIAPPRCFGVSDIAPGRRLSAIAVQLYSLRGGHTGGFGDLAAFSEFATHAAPFGIDAVSVSPLHARLPGIVSPYSPSTRYFLDPLYADVSLAGGTALADDGGAQIDWPVAARDKVAALTETYRRCRSSLPPNFAEFRSQGGERLFRHALFEALDEHFRAKDVFRWREWPAPFRDPQSAEVAVFARAHKDAVTFRIFLQWLAAASLRTVQNAARDAGMAIGVIADLAVGMDPAGSHAWSARDELLHDVNVGAPPDLINAHGQDWGLTALSPSSFGEHGYGSFIATLRAAMRHAGGMRMDHAMGAFRLWLVPNGARATDGVYLQYPMHDLLNLIALESHRHRAVVIGEDLGTVPDGFRETLARAGILGMEVLWFQRDGRRFLPPDRWTKNAAALTTTHDLPTVAGWWRGHDLDWFERLGRQTDRGWRIADRGELWSALVDAGGAHGAEPAPNDTAPVVEAALDFVGRAPSQLAIVPAEDVLGLVEQPNIPGTIDEHPNWRRRLPPGDPFAAPEAKRNLAALRRGRSGNQLK